MTQDDERQVGDITVSAGDRSKTVQEILVPVDDYMALLGRTLTWIQKTHVPYFPPDAGPAARGICSSCTAIVAARRGREAVPWPCPVMVELGPVYSKAAELIGNDNDKTTNEETAADGQDDEG